MIEQYTVRRYRPEDLTAFLRSYQEVFDQDVTPEWFAWKYEDNPYAEDVPVWVATTDGEFVGAAGFWPLVIDVGGRTVRAIQPCDAMVRAAHRRRGIYDEILGTGLDHYRERDPWFCIDFPNELTRAAFEKYGWRIVRRHPTYYRIQGGGAMPGSASGVTGLLVDAVARGYLRVREAVSRPATDGFAVEHHDGVRGDLLAAIHRSARPDGFHAVRDEGFYDWRFGTPRWEVETLVASDEDGPLAGAVLATRTHRGTTTTRLADVVPLGADDRDRAYAAVLDAAVRARADSDLIAAPPEVLPDGVLTDFGFHRDDRFPLSRVGELTNFGVYPLSGDHSDEAAWELDGRRLTDPDAWSITFGEMDLG